MGNNIKKRRHLAAVTLAAALAVPLVSIPSVQAQVTPPATRPSASAAELLSQGVRQYRNHQYEEAEATLKQIQAGQLTADQRKQYQSTLSSTTTAANHRREARAQFDQGQAALKANRPADAMAHFKSVLNNSDADVGTSNKAKEQMAVAESVQKQMAKAAEASYKKAKSEYNKGDWIAARKDFNAAKAGGYKAGLFEDSPATYLERMDRKEQADAKKHAEELAAQRQNQQNQSNAAASSALSAAAAQQHAEAVSALNKYASEPAPAKTESTATATQSPATPAAKAPEAQPAAAATPVAKAPAAPAQTAQASNQPAKPAVSNAATPAATGTQSQVAQAANALNEASGMDRIRQQQAQFQAKTLVDQAQKAQQAGDYSEALDLYIRATELDPTNQAAQQGRQSMATLTGRTTGAASPLNERATEIRVTREAINYRFNQGINSAQQAIANHDFGTARRQLDAARLASLQNPAIFSQQEIHQFQVQLDNTNLSLQQAQQQYEAQAQAQSRAEALKNQEKLNKTAAEDRQRAVAALVKQSMQLTQDGQYQAALGVINQILVLDPNNDYAIGAKPLVQDRANFKEQRTYREQFDQELTKQLNAAEEKKIPYNDIYRYPTNWPDIVSVREKSVKEEQGLKASDEAVQALLDKRLPEVKFDGVAFTDVMDFFRDVTGANIFVNWRALEQSGIDKNAPVTARLHDVKFSKALTTVLQEVAPPSVRLSYTIDEGVITISTAEDLSKNVSTQVYDIRDIIFEVPDFSDAPTFDLSQIGNSTSGGGGGGGGGGGNSNLFGNTNQQQNTPEQAKQERKERVDEIVKLIQDTVAPESWRDTGGTIGSVRELSGQLIVTQTPDNQASVRGLLEKLRETRAIEVSIEARFLTVQRNFLEDVGLDVDFSFNNLGNVSSKWGPFVVNQNSADFTENPSTAAPGSLASVQQIAGAGTSGEPAVKSAALSMTGNYGNPFLDDFTVNFLLRATQANQTSTILTAPRITLFNGQRAYMLVATQHAYVSNLTAATGTNSVAFNPTVSTVQSGVLLDVQATVSSDRKYVTLTLRPQLATLIDLVNFTFQSLPQGATGTPGTGTNNNNTTIPNVTAGNGTLQQPILQITEVHTTVTVPDGGTLLLGGQTISGETEKEMGVPVLSKIPFLKRLFTNRSSAHDDQVLLILVKPTIIIQREQEQQQFPLLSSRLSNQ